MTTFFTRRRRYNRAMKLRGQWGKGIWILMLLCGVGLFGTTMPNVVQAANISSYSDTISTSEPGEYANHTIKFTPQIDVPPNSYIEVVPPAGFSVRATSTFTTRNVEMYVNGVRRTATSSAVATSTDGISIATGTPGAVRYTLNGSEGVSKGDVIELRIGDHTSQSRVYQQFFSSSTMSTTTIPDDVPGIQNGTATGTHEVAVSVVGASAPIENGFLISLVDPISAGGDTTETIPPFRFNPAPTTTISGTTQFVEISLETNEFSNCRYATEPGVSFNSMNNDFDTDLKIVHSSVVPVTLGEMNKFYVRCIDDEDNFNTDDFVIQFPVNDQPSGTANEEGDVEGDGTGQGNTGSGDGDGAGGQTGQYDGNTSEEGSATGGGGSGGGSGTGGEGDDGSDYGGGFGDDAPYESGDGQVRISGYAVPDSEVTFLVDGQPAMRVDAEGDGRFSGTLEEIARGAYTFGIYAVDADDVRSSTFSTSFTVTGSRGSSLSNINIAPSLVVSPDPVDPGQTLTVSGYTLPNAAVTVENDSDQSGVAANEFTATSDSDGAWSVTIDTGGFSQGTYKVRARAEQTDGLGVQTGFSDYTFYGVGQEADRPINADLNTDGSVNLTDFSILLFWWGGAGGDSDPPADINQDGTVDLTDFSIMLFNWTG